MFDRRAKIFLLMLIGLMGVLVARAVQVQVFNREEWRQQAVRLMTRPQLIETTRGRLLDRRGRVLAEDVACIDACVDYRAVVSQPDANWVRSVARQRLARNMGAEYRALDLPQREQLLREEIGRVHSDMQIMWHTLARLGGKSIDEIEEIRQSIVRKVELRRRYLWYWKYQAALKGHENREPSPWYRRWLIDDTQDAPELDQFGDIHISEETQAHVILPAISNDIYIQLGKNSDRFPGLVLQPSMHRYYPYHEAAAHLIGHLAKVSREDIEADANTANDLRRYWPNDLIGRGGLEALCEPLLRGTRGRVERYFGEVERELARSEPVMGIDVKTTIDIELQRDVQAAFTQVVLDRKADPPDTLAMPGAAVVIDVPSGEVVAMVSYPSFDVNTLDEQYAQLVADDVNKPLTNRATQFALEPGSAVKPIVGLAAITQGVMKLDDTIECTGYLQLGGRVYKTEARCWVASNFFEQLQGGVAHHPIPWDAPHPTGFLDFRDALERSCNVYFETLADRLGVEGVAHWMRRFGLGRPTGIGIAEVRGKLPGDTPIPAYRRRAAAWFAAIGQDQVLATPIQMANVAATIARGGIWMRPRLVPEGTEITKPADDLPDRVDLKLNRAAAAAVKEGMTRVVNSRAGTGTSIHRDDLLIAGKTGTAQAAPLRVPVRDEAGRIVYRTATVPQRDARGNVTFVEKQIPVRRTLTLGTREQPNPQAPWYRGSGENQDRRSHAWFIGFVPANDPKIAFAVLVEYGGGGGVTAGQVAKQMLDACIKHGYLRKQ